MEGGAGCGGGAIKGSRDQKPPKISSYFYLFGCLRGGSVKREDLGRRSKIFQNLDIMRGLKMVIAHMASYLIIRFLVMV